MTATIDVGERRIGSGHPCYLIAEVGTTCLGDLQMALDLVAAGAAAGMDAVKFQVIDAAQVSDASQTYAVQWGGNERRVNMKEMFSKLQFDAAQWQQIAAACAEAGVDFFATVDYADGVDLLETLGVSAHKIGAWDTTFKPLIERIAATGKPMFVDLGPTTQGEVDALKRWYGDAGGDAIIFLHDFHTDQAAQMNMAAITHLLATQPWPAGYSSPGRDNDLDFLALGLGAAVIEKRLILKRDIEAFHAHESLEPDELSAWVARIRRAEASVGVPAIRPSDKDLQGAQSYYRSICTTRPVRAGEVFSRDNLGGKRPGTGIPTERLDEFWGKAAARDLDADTLLSDGDAQ